MRRFRTTAALLAATLASSVILIAPSASAASFDPAGTVSSDAPVSPSGAGVNAIIGPDDRVRVTPTTAYPASAIVLLRFSGGQCTGFMIDHRTVATAGWCTYDPYGAGWRTNVVAYPAFDGSVAPFGSCPASKLYAAAGWSHGADGRHNFGAVRLQCNLGAMTGWLNLAPVTGSPAGSCTYTAGYPADKPATMWGSTGTLYENNGRLHHTHDTVFGDDGSPIILGDHDLCRKPLPVPVPQPRRVLAIRAFDPALPSANTAIPITGDVFNTYFNWTQDSQTGG